MIPYETTLHVRDRCLCLHVQRAARALARRFDEVFRHLDLTNGQFSLLMSLNRPQPTHMRSIAAVLAMDRTTLTAALKTLQRRGLVSVRPDPADGRGRLLRLTASGLELLARALPIWRREHRQLDSLLGPARPGQLRRDLQALASGEATDGEPPRPATPIPRGAPGSPKRPAASRRSR